MSLNVKCVTMDMDPERNASTRFAALSALFDASSQRHLADRGVASGWHCLEVGGGGGSIAEVAQRAGRPAGRVVVTDVDIRFLRISSARMSRCATTSRAIRCPSGPSISFTREWCLIHLPARDQCCLACCAHSPGGGSSVKNSTARPSLLTLPCLLARSLEDARAMGLAPRSGVAPTTGDCCLADCVGLGLTGLGPKRGW